MRRGRARGSRCFYSTLFIDSFLPIRKGFLYYFIPPARGGAERSAADTAATRVESAGGGARCKLSNVILINKCRAQAGGRPVQGRRELLGTRRRAGRCNALACSLHMRCRPVPAARFTHTTLLSPAGVQSSWASSSHRAVLAPQESGSCTSSRALGRAPCARAHSAHRRSDALRCARLRSLRSLSRRLW